MASLPNFAVVSLRQEGPRKIVYSGGQLNSFDSDLEKY